MLFHLRCVVLFFYCLIFAFLTKMVNIVGYFELIPAKYERKMWCIGNRDSRASCSLKIQKHAEEVLNYRRKLSISVTNSN
jgi:hypothetical protein